MLAVAGAAPATNALSPQPAVIAGVTELPLHVGRLFVPTNCRPAGSRVELLVHFHGHLPLMVENFLKAGRPGALLVLNFPGLSAAYAKPFQDTNEFSRVLAETQDRLTKHFGRNTELGPLVVSSFSAGFGAVREILQQPAAEAITTLVLADTLYAGYVTNDGKRAPDPAHLKDFVRFARRAADGRATMIVTHSQLVPGSYASTVETAEVLIAAAGTTRRKTSDLDSTSMTLESVADRGGFHLRSYEGTTGQDHMNHLRQIHAAWQLVPRERKP